MKIYLCNRAPFSKLNLLGFNQVSDCMKNGNMESIMVLIMLLPLALAGEHTTYDLTHTFNKDTLTWPGDTPFTRSIIHEGHAWGFDWISMGAVEVGEHVGTHIDSPSHFLQGAWTLDQIPIERMRGPGVVIDVRDKVKNNITYQYSREDIDAWEEKYGQMPPRAVVLFCSGWSEHWGDSRKLLGTDTPKDASTFRFPSLSISAATWLVTQRHVYGVGTEAPSIEPPAHTEHKKVPTHQALFRGKAWALEMVKNPCQLPPRGSIIGAYPMKVEGGSGGPTRIVAVVRGNDAGRLNASVFLVFCITVISFVWF